mgnify:CR=1 FL=1
MKALANAAWLTWGELRRRFGWKAFLPFVLLLLAALLAGLLAVVPQLAPFIYPLF